MALFLSRRSFNRSTGKFTKNAAEVTRYVSLPTAEPSPGWQGNLLSQQDWLAKVRAEDQSGEVLVFVHGFNTSQTGMLKRLGQLTAGLRAAGYRGAVVGFDWPSDGSLFAYGRDLADVKRTAPFLVVDGLAPLLRMRPRPRVHVFGHSMGAFAILRSFARVPGNWKIDQVVLASADLFRDRLESGTDGALVMAHRCARLTNYYSTVDSVLGVSGTIANPGKLRAGRDGLPEDIPKSFEDVYATKQYQDKVPTDGLGDGDRILLSHRWWFEEPGFLRDAALTLAGTPADQMPTRPTSNIADHVLYA